LERDVMASLIDEADGLWRVEFSGLDKKRKRVRLGRMSRGLADRFSQRLEDLISELVGGGVPSRESSRWLEKMSDHHYQRLEKVLPIERRVLLSLDQWRKQFIAGCSGMASGSRDKLEQTFDKLIEFFQGSRLLREIKPDDATRWRTWLETHVSNVTQRQLSIATVKTHVGNARTIFGRAVKAKLIVESAFVGQQGGSTPSENLPFVPWQDLESVLREIKNPALRLRVALCRYAGLRVDSEPPRLTWAEHVDFDRRRLLIPCSKTKRYAGKSFRVVPIDERLMRHLSLRYRLKLADDVSVCGTHRVTATNKATIARAIKRAGVTPWRKLFQALRASYDSELRADGVATDFASKMTGHSAEMSRRHYTTSVPEVIMRQVTSRYTPDEVRKAARNPAHLGAESTGRNGNGQSGNVQKVQQIRRIPVSAGPAGNPAEMGDKGLEPLTFRV